MTKSRLVAWLALIASSQVSAVASAQDMSFGLDETESSEASVGASAEVESDGDVIGDLAGDDSSTSSRAPQAAGPKLSEVNEEIYAVQQIYALRNNRLELMPSFGFTLNDPYVSHPNIGIGLNYWITNVLAIGANVNWYRGLENESDVNFHVRRAARLATRPTNFQFGASLNFTYVPVYGKFSMFNRYIFQWDAYVVGGVGVMNTRPVPVVDPAFRSFDYSYKLSIINPGLGFRVFLSKWLTVFMEGRMYPYLEKLENLSVALGDSARKDKSTWQDNSSTLVYNVVASVGMTIYFPFKFEYKLPK